MPNPFRHSRPLSFPGRLLKGRERRLRRGRIRSQSGSVAAEVQEQRTLLTVLAVTSLDVDGEVTLREALGAANSNAAVGDAATGQSGVADVIEFAPGLTGTIQQQPGQLNISDSVTINGLGADVLAIDATQQSRVLHITSAGDVSISGLTITGGRALGGGIRNDDSTLTLGRVTLELVRKTPTLRLRHLSFSSRAVYALL